MPKPDSDMISDAYGAQLAKLYDQLFGAYQGARGPDANADKNFANGVKLARQARDKAIQIVSAP